MSTSGDCVFCQIVAGDIPSRLAYSGPLVFGFHDLHPEAPVHVLLVPRQHLTSAADITAEHGDALAEMMMAARQVADEAGISDGGYRLVLNVGDDAGASVYHMHMHVLGGRRLAWPPG
jgi:histidine triad (HIT) family protein